MKWSKRLESLTEKGEFGSHASSIPGCSLGGDVGVPLDIRRSV